MRRWVGVLGAAAAAAVAVGATAIPWNSIFAGSSAGLAVWFASLAGALLGLATFRRSPVWALLGGVVVLLVGVLAGEPRGLATLGLLMRPTVALLAIPLAVSLVAAWWAHTIWTWTSRAMPGAAVAPLLAALPIVAAHAVASLYTVGQRPSGWVLGLVTLAAFLVGSLASRLGGPHGLRWQPALAVTAVALLAAGLGLRVGDDDPVDLRARLSPPVEVVDGTSPLSLVKAGLVEEEPEPVFTITLDGLGADTTIDRIPVAVLDRYDGAVWSSTGEFVPAGRDLPRLREQGLVGETVGFTVELAEQYPFHQLPLPGTLRRLDDGDLLWDDTSGMVIVDDLPSAGDSYSGSVAVSAVDRADEGEPGGIGGYLGTGVDPSGAELRDLPPEMDQFARSVLSTDDARVQLDQIEAALRASSFVYNESAPGGHSRAALARYTAADSISQGFAEQSAATFALIARRLGIPARIVVGYQPTEPLSAANPSATLTEDQVHAWPEVWINGVGWMAYDPTNPENTSDQAVERPPAVAAAPPESGDGVREPDLGEPEYLPDLETDESSVPWWLLLVVGVPLLYLALVLGAKAVRRWRRRRSGDPARRIVGAWWETTDQLTDAGRHPAPGGTVIDLRDRILVPVGAPEEEVVVTDSAVRAASALDELSIGVDHAIYAPDQPPAEDVDRAWSSAGDALGSLKSDWSGLDRVRGALNPRSLFRRHR